MEAAAPFRSAVQDERLAADRADEGLAAWNPPVERRFFQARLLSELISARTRAKLTQAEVAQRMGTTQSAIARLEGGHSRPSMRSVERYAAAIGHRAVVRLECV